MWPSNNLNGGGERLDEAFNEFREEFIHHVNMEEAILYPNLLKIPSLKSIVHIASEEFLHDVGEQILYPEDPGSHKWHP